MNEENKQILAKLANIIGTLISNASNYSKDLVNRINDVIDDINKINVIEKYICGQGSKECESCFHAKPHALIVSGHNRCSNLCPFASGACVKVSEFNENNTN